MTREQWLRVKAITAAALEQPEAHRDGFVADACRGDAWLQREVRSLLTSAVEAAPLFEPPVLSPTPTVAVLNDVRAPLPEAGARIGPYRIVRELGRGGMGAVFLAERADQAYEQRVALKIVDYLKSPDALQWFRDERQILATLDHPNIARLLDGGTTTEGLPYLVMEYVDGLPVDEYCTAHALPVRPRLDVFLQICAAVDLAHRSLIVHRDLKPRNILVQGGVPKLLDFGVATLLEAAGRAPRSHAIAAPPLFTPEYASPEQLALGPITTATDVYALGVLLFRLLTDRSPYGPRTDDAGELATAIAKREPLPPSAAAATPRLRRRLAGDLDTIVLKALKKQPSDRYSSAGALADDVRRHLAGLPVTARADGAVYRAGKFVRRHAVGVGATLLVVLSLFGGLAATVWQARETERERARAQRHFDDVRQLASSLIFEVHDSLENVPGTLPTRRLIVTRALDYFDGLAAEAQQDVRLQRELAGAYDTLGNVLGRPYAANLGDANAALASYRKALAIRERLARVAPGDRQTQLDLWSSNYNIGGILRETADTAGALALHEKAREVIERLLASAPDEAALQRQAAQTSSTLGTTYVQAGRLDAALAAGTRALTLNQRLLAADPANLALQNDVATALGRVGQTEMKLGRLAAAQQHVDEAFRLATGLVAAQPANVAFVRRLSNNHAHLAQLRVRSGDAADAWSHQQQALALRQRLANQTPADRQAAIDLMVARLETGEVLVRRGDREGAATYYQAAIARAESLADADPSYVYYRLVLATALTRLARVRLAQGDAADAAATARRAAMLMESASRLDPADVRTRYEVAMAGAVLAEALAGPGVRTLTSSAGGTGDDAAAWRERSLAILDELRRGGRRGGGPFDEDESTLIASLNVAAITGSEPAAP